MRLAFILPLWFLCAFPKGSQLKQPLYAGDTDPDYPVLNIHVAEPPDNFELERSSNTFKSLRRQLTELEERRVGQTEAAASAMAATMAQIQTLIDVAESLVARISKAA